MMLGLDGDVLRKFVLAEDRQAIVDQHVKGTTSHFVLSILHALNKGRYHDAEVLLHEWDKVARRQGLPPDYELLKNRCMLCLYEKKPEDVLAHFQRAFNIKLQHPAPTSATSEHASRSVAPSKVDQSLLDFPNISKRKLETDTYLNDFTEAATSWLMDRWKTLSKEQLNRLLRSRVTYPTHPTIVDMLVADMANAVKAKRNIDLHPVVAHLSLAQLDKIFKACSSVSMHREFVTTYLRKLAATFDAKAPTRLHTDQARMQEYLEACVAFTSKLPPVFNDLRAAAIFRKLQFLVAVHDVYDAQLFETYLKLPKRAPQSIAPTRKEGDIAFTVAHTGLQLPGVDLSNENDDTPFITEFLEHLFRQKSVTSPKPFDRYLQERFVKRVFAESKLASGDDKPDTHAAVLSDLGNVEAFNKQKRLEFTRQNKQQYGVGEPVVLSVELKNIPSLDVQVFEVNTFNYYKDKSEPVPAKLNIDGLLPNLKATRSYKEFPSIAIHRHDLELQEIKRRGVYLVELRGGGLSSRAMVSVGQLYATTAAGVAGTEVRVYNELGEHLPEATVWMEGREYGRSRAEHNHISLPFSSHARRAKVILQHDGFYALATVPLYDEQYSFSFQCLVNHETAIQGNLQARLVLLPKLTANDDTCVPPTLIAQPRVTTTFRDRAANVLTQADHGIAFSDTADVEVVVKVPPGAATLDVAVSGSITKLDGTKEQVSHMTTHRLLDTSVVGSLVPDASSMQATIDNIYLVNTGTAYVLHVRGRCGEARKGVQLTLTMQHAFLVRAITTTLQTDEHGQVVLGPLANVLSLQATLRSGHYRRWRVQDIHGNHPLPSSLTVMESEAFDLPFDSSSSNSGRSGAAADAVRLFAEDANSGLLTMPVDNAITFAHGHMRVTLPCAGNYKLLITRPSLESSSVTAISITALPRNLPALCRGTLPPLPASSSGARGGSGSASAGGGARTYTACPQLVGGSLSPALVHVREMSANRDTGDVRVCLGNAQATTRVHVFTRWSSVGEPELEALESGDDCLSGDDNHHAPADAPPPECRYLSGRVLSEEHQYVLRRKAMPPRLGNMLPKPTLVLNPAEVRETETRREHLEREKAWRKDDMQGAMGCRRRMRRAGGKSAKKKMYGGAMAMPTLEAVSCYDWLETPAAVVTNLRPAVEGADGSGDGSSGAGVGVVTVKLTKKALAAASRVFVVVVDEGQLLFDSTAVSSTSATSGSDSSKAAVPRARDVRHSWPHDLETPYAEQREVIAVNASEPWSSSSSSASQSASDTDASPPAAAAGSSADGAVFETVDTVGKLFSSLVSLLPNSDAASALSKFSFLASWPTLSTEAKTQHYADNYCHELNLFIFNKDPTFFEEVVRPHLASKLDKDVMDCCLLYSNLDACLPALRRRQPLADCPAVEQFLLAWRGVLSAPELASLMQATTKDMRNSPEIAGLFDRLITAKQQAVEEEQQLQHALHAMADEEEEESEAGEGAMGGADMDFFMAQPMAAAPQAEMMEASALFDMDTTTAAAPPPPPAAARAAPRMLMSAAPAPGAMLSRARRTADVTRDRMAAPKLAAPVGKTKEYTEKTYWDHNAEKRFHLRVTPFWADCVSALAASGAGDSDSDGDGVGRPTCMARTWLHATKTVNEALLALAIVDLPFDNTMAVDEEQRVTHTGNCFVLTRALRPVHTREEGKMMVFQTFFDPQGAVDAAAPEEFETGRVYGSRIICTNMTSTTGQLDLLRQVPNGAVPLPTVSSKRSEHVPISPFGNHRLEVFFYFPLPGEFACYPACLSKEGALLSMAPLQRVKAVTTLSTYDTTSWPAVAAHGTNDEVLAFLRENPKSQAEIHLVLWRLRDKQFFLELVSLLRKTGAFFQNVWAYAFLHRDEASLAEYMAANQRQFGPGVHAKLLTTPWNLNFRHSDFWPVINARAHSITDEKTQLLNDAILEKQAALFGDLAFSDALPPPALPSLCYFLILEDDVDGARTMLQRARASLRDDEVCSLQLDYLECYLDFFKGPELTAAREIVAKRAKMSLPGWQSKFQSIGEMIAEIDSGEAVSAESQARAALPAMDISLDNNDVVISYSGMAPGATATVSFYVMDIELLFSSQPFGQDGKKSSIYVLPNISTKVPLPDGKSSVTYALPSGARTHDGLVEVTCAGLTRSLNFFSSQLRVQALETHGHIHVMDKQGGAVPAAYVKVYARKGDDTVSFFKDGYTDLRGKFDYFSVNTEERDVKELAILVWHKTHGAHIQTVKPPSH